MRALVADFTTMQMDLVTTILLACHLSPTLFAISAGRCVEAPPSSKPVLLCAIVVFGRLGAMTHQEGARDAMLPVRDAVESLDRYVSLTSLAAAACLFNSPYRQQ